MAWWNWQAGAFGSLSGTILAIPKDVCPPEWANDQQRGRSIVGGELGTRSISRDGPSREPAAPIGDYVGLLLSDTARTSMMLRAEHGELSDSVHMDRVCKSRYISESTFNRVHKQLVQCGLVACMPAARSCA